MVSDGKRISLCEFCVAFILKILDVLRDYFYSWRPYKLILKRMLLVHGERRRFVNHEGMIYY